jgi:hypothetical protein
VQGLKDEVVLDARVIGRRSIDDEVFRRQSEGVGGAAGKGKDLGGRHQAHKKAGHHGPSVWSGSSSRRRSHGSATPDEPYCDITIGSDSVMGSPVSSLIGVDRRCESPKLGFDN